MRFFRKLRRKLPKKQDIENTPSLSIFKSFWKRPELWAMNRNSIPVGISVGIFCAFLPMPFEMLAAAFLAIVLGGNIVFAISMVWISNPLTWVPLYTPCYLFGARLLRLDPIAITEMSSFKINTELGYHYAALWLGCLIIGVTISSLTYAFLRIIWRRQVQYEWSERKKYRLRKRKKSSLQSQSSKQTAE